MAARGAITMPAGRRPAAQTTRRPSPSLSARGALLLAERPELEQEKVEGAEPERRRIAPLAPPGPDRPQRTEGSVLDYAFQRHRIGVRGAFQGKPPECLALRPGGDSARTPGRREGGGREDQRQAGDHGAAGASHASRTVGARGRAS
jgi:hypothetical protein